MGVTWREEGTGERRNQVGVTQNVGAQLNVRGGEDIRGGDGEQEIKCSGG